MFRQLKFDANGGKKLSWFNAEVAPGETIGKLPTVGKKKYAFKGWYTQKKGGKKISAKTKITQNQTVYARWKKISVKRASAPTVKKAGKGKTSGAKVYQITYSTSPKFTGSKKITAKSLKKTIRKLKEGKTYHVKVRAYKLDSLKQKVYGKYSKTVKVKL